MLYAEVRFSWTPSVSDDVIKQTIHVENADEDSIIHSDVLEPHIRATKFKVPEDTNIRISLIAHTYESQSDPLVFEFILDDLEMPAPLSPLAPKIEVLGVEHDGS